MRFIKLNCLRKSCTQSCFLIIITLIISGCISFAPPAPLVTFGGPKTVPPKKSEVGIAVGTAAVLFEKAHSGGSGYFGRYKYGLSEKWDLGIDFIGATHSDKGVFTLKLASRYQLQNNLRLEVAVGAADDSEGKSINSDFALTYGSIDKQYWNYYTSVRLGIAKGFAGNAAFSDSNNDDNSIPSDNLIGLINLGTQAKINQNQYFIFEGGFGYLFPKSHKPALILFISCGLLFQIGD